MKEELMEGKEDSISVLERLVTVRLMQEDAETIYSWQDCTNSA